MTTETFTLSRPLKTHDGEVTTLTLKEPTGGAFVDYDDPFTVKPDGETGNATFVYHNKAFIKFLSNMTGIDDLILKGISASDFIRLRGVATNMIAMGVKDKAPFEQSGE